MRTLLHYNEEVPEGIDELIQEIREWLDVVPLEPAQIEGESKGLCTYHGLVRAVHKKWNLGQQQWNVADGFFVPRRGHHIEHCWVARGSTRQSYVLDICPVGVIGGPLLIDHGSFSPWYGIYLPRPTLFEDRQREFIREAQAILAA